MSFNFNPTDGLLNLDIFPSEPLNETAARQQFMTLFNQIKDKLNTVEAQLNTPGQIMFFAKNTPPTGWLKCDGSAISRTTYNGLFNIIGTAFGAGDGSTTFNLPDLRGEFIRGWDDSKGTDAGRVFGSNQVDQMQGHQHTLTVRTKNGNALADHPNIGENGTTSFYTTNNIVSDGTNGTPRTGTETRPRNIAFLACIKF